jgi:hypothetical protein
MAVPKKGWRKITVDDRRFYWRTLGSDWVITLVVVTDAAFIPQATSQQLRVSFKYDYLETPNTWGGATLTQQAAITPKIVRLAIEQAMKMEPPFTGEIGAEDISLNPAILQELQQQARVTQPPSL